MQGGFFSYRVIVRDLGHQPCVLAPQIHAVVSCLGIGIPVTVALLKHAGVYSLFAVAIGGVIGGVVLLASIAVHFCMLNKALSEPGLDDHHDLAGVSSTVPGCDH